jgi:hypothetical protein
MARGSPDGDRKSAGEIVEAVAGRSPRASKPGYSGRKLSIADRLLDDRIHLVGPRRVSDSD